MNGGSVVPASNEGSNVTAEPLAPARPADAPVALARLDEVANTVLSGPLKPFLRWAGSKRRLLPQMLPHVPDTFDRYVEPFLGSGSLFLHLAPEVALLNDACSPLIDTWHALRQDPAAVYYEATRRPLVKDEYYAARSERGGGLIEEAGRFIYLNKGAFNGLYRVNMRGEFNVPWGAPKTQFVSDLTNLREISELLRRPSVSLLSGDFERVIERTGSGDFVFVDPPYVTSHNDNGFIAYNEKIFSWEDQVRLARCVRDAVARGAHVLITNAFHPSVLSLYDGFDVVTMERASTLAASREKRGRTKEALVIGRPNK